MSDTILTDQEAINEEELNEIQADPRLTDTCYHFWSSVLDVTRGPTNIVPLPEYTPLVGDYFMTVEADPSDTLKLKFSDGTIATRPMYCTAWMRSLDYLLYRYMTLTLQKQTGKLCTVFVSPAIYKKYWNYGDRSKVKKKHTFTFLPEYLSQPATRTTEVNKRDYYTFQTQCCYEPAILNLFAHEIFTRSDHDRWRRNPRRDALIWTDKIYGADAIPNYGLECFMAHELLTGISLTTEITAALLEIDETIRTDAFEHFCEHTLNDVVRLPFPFARASAARDYFFQINLDFATEKYRWRRNYADDLVQHVLVNSSSIASRHIDLLHKASFCPEKPYYFWEQSICDTEKPKELQQRPYYFGPTYAMSFPKTDDPYQIDAYLKQIESYLKAAVSPLNWESIYNSPRKNLVIFANPHHKYIPLLMRYLETGFLDKDYGGDKLPLNIDAFKSLFQQVHEQVKKASIRTYNKDMTWIQDFIDRN